MTPDSFIFWFLAMIAIICGLGVVLFANPIYSALSLVMTMVCVAALFVTLEAFFIAGVQLIVYAGAVMVLFVMVIMLFDLRHDLAAFSRGKISGALKLITVGSILGLIAGAVVSANSVIPDDVKKVPSSVDAIKSLGINLFTKYTFAFEALGVLLLIIAIGTVALSKSRGGTHAD